MIWKNCIWIYHHGRGEKNEAVFYLSFLPESYEKYIVMLHATHEKRDETLAEYYYRMNKHLIGSTKVAEFDPVTKEFHIVGDIGMFESIKFASMAYRGFANVKVWCRMENCIIPRMLCRQMIILMMQSAL